MRSNLISVIKEVVSGCYGRSRGRAGAKGRMGRGSGKVPQNMGPKKRKKRILGKGKGVRDDRRNCGVMAGNEAGEMRESRSRMRHVHKAEEGELDHESHGVPLNKSKQGSDIIGFAFQKAPRKLRGRQTV